MAKTFYVIDGHSQIFRAYHAMRPGSMTGPDGEPTWATFIFIRMLLKFIRERRPTYLAMAIDGPRAELKRTAEYPDYKANRPPLPEDFPPQEAQIFRAIEALGIPMLKAQGYEADDILATIAEQLAGEEMDVVIVSRDKDLDQLVNDHVVLYDPMKDEMLDAATIETAKGYRPDQAVEVQALMGDSSDNIPGVPGVGPKTAAKLIAKYGTAEAVLEHADEQTPKLSENLLKHAADLRLSRQLVELDRDVPIELDLDEMRTEAMDYENLRPLFEELGFQSLLDDLDAAKQTAEGGEPNPDAARDGTAEPSRPAQATTPARPSKTTTAEDFDYRLIDTPEALAEVAEVLGSVSRLSVDTETTSVQPMWASLVGISLAWEPGRGVYIPVAGPLMATTLEAEAVREAVGPALADPNIEKIAHNLKYDRIVLQQAGYELAGPCFDTLIAAHVLDSSRLTYKLDALALDILNHKCIPIEEIIGSGRNQTTMDAVPTETVAPYAAEDADVALRLAEVLRPQLQAEGLDVLLRDVEMPLLPVLAEMERTGIRVDPQRLKAMAVELGSQAEALHDAILHAAGRPFNPDSPKQLGEVLFEELGFPVVKRTKTGPSTNSSVLEQLAAEHADKPPLPALILKYRKLTKLIGTYLKALGECIHPTTGRVHTSFHQAGTATGRLSSSDPNLQNIPIRTEEGRQIRSAFVADDGCKLLAADYSQVELRMLAHFCRDETLMQAFADDQDIHAIVAAEVFGVPLADVTPEQRGRAKGVNFGIIYGQTAFGLARGLQIPQREAAEFITTYHQRFPRIHEFLDACIRQAKQAGYVETIFKRRRPIAEIDSSNAQRRAAAERLAINSVVQGSAADLIKQAMIKLDARIRNEDRKTRMLLQIHDELVFEIPEADVETDRSMIVEEMTQAIELAVPLKVDVGVGENWLEAK
jgi:DNA polymerase-1